MDRVGLFDAPSSGNASGVLNVRFRKSCGNMIGHIRVVRFDEYRCDFSILTLYVVILANYDPHPTARIS